MNGLEWSVVILWPVVVVIINNVLAGLQAKHMAEVTCENFNKTGRTLEMLLDSVRDIERVLEKQGVEIASLIDAKTS